MNAQQLAEAKRLLRAGAGADWCASDTIFQLAERSARALWAVRVLDAHGRMRGRLGPPAPRDHRNGYFEVRLDEPPVAGCAHPRRFVGQDEDAARLIAAEAVFPELPEAVRQELGAKP